MTTRRYRIECSGTTHTVEFTDGGGLVFVDHGPGFAEAIRAELAFATLAGTAKPVFEHDGCKRVACRLAGGPGNFCNRDPDERRLYAELRGVRLARKLRRQA